jgi:hypothetical protein
MPGTSHVRLAGLSLALVLTACAAYQAQHGGGAPAAGPEDHDHPAQVQAPSGEFTELPENVQISRIRGEAEAVKASLAQQGRYLCCVEPACTECLLKYGECHCREAVRKEGPCCGECTEAWVEGRGAVEGVNAWELLERKKAVLDEVNRKAAGGGEKPPPPEHPHH